MRARVDDVESRGRIGSAGYAEFGRIREGARAAFAESVSSDPERIALTHSTSGAMNLVLGGLAFAPGDEIVTTDNEHPGLLEPLAALTRRYGVVVRVAEALQGSDPLDAIASQIGSRTRLVALSHVLWANGRILPLRAISEAAHAAGAPLLVDGAQGVGAVDVDPVALGVDAYAGTGQKWLCGPNGVGFLWLADGFEERFEVAAPSYYTRDFRSEGAPFWPGARRHDGASLATAGLAGLTAAVEFRRQLVGWSEGAAEMAGVRARCVALLSGVPGVTVQAESEGAAPLVAFTVDGRTAEDVVEGLEAAGVLARTLPGLDWVRVSLGYWVSDGDLERLAAALRPA
jgi:L-cysteine/cystine lyase